MSATLTNENIQIAVDTVIQVYYNILFSKFNIDFQLLPKGSFSSSWHSRLTIAKCFQNLVSSNLFILIDKKL